MLPWSFSAPALGALRRRRLTQKPITTPIIRQTTPTPTPTPIPILAPSDKPAPSLDAAFLGVVDEVATAPVGEVEAEVELDDVEAAAWLGVGPVILK